MKTLVRSITAALFLAVLIAPQEARGQFYGSLGAGVSSPFGDFGDDFDRGYTVRGQVGMSLILAGAHAQVGWSRFPVAEGRTGDDANIYHAGIGGRLGLGLIFLGANAMYFSGYGESDQDDGGMAIVPEVGISLLKLEVVADARMGGNAKWLGLRAGLKF